MVCVCFFGVKKKAAYDMRIRYWSSDVCSSDLQVQLVGDSSQTLAELGRNLVPILSRRAELRDVHVDAGDQNSELSVRVDRERAAAFGFSAQEVSPFVGLALRGAPLRQFRLGQTAVPVWVGFAGADADGMAGIPPFLVLFPD